MKYAVVYTGCQIVEADNEDEAMKEFHEGNSLMEIEGFAYVNPCFGDTDAIDDVCYEECWEAAIKLSGGNDKLRKAMMAGYYAIINNKKLEGSLYHNYENGDEISFREAAKYLVCTANGLDPQKHEIEVG